MAIPHSCQPVRNRSVRPRRLRISAFAVLLAVSIQSSTFAQLGDVTQVHDPRIIQAGDAFYCFSTGIGIPIRRSRDLIHWEAMGVVFSTLPGWVTKEYPNARFIWAPDISYFGDTYHLYYAVSRFGRNDSRIGLATNTTLDPQDPKYQWIDQGKIVETHPKDATRPGDNWNAIDPAIAFDADKNPWLVMGSFWDGIKMRRIDAKTGRLSADDATLYSLARRPRPDAIEAGFIFHRGDYFYLFASFDYCCRGIRSTYKIAVGRSTKITGPYEDNDKKPMLEGGGTIVMASRDNIIGPGHCGIFTAMNQDWLVHHYYDGFNFGRPTLEIQPIHWSKDGWPSPGNPIATSRPSSTRPAQYP